MGILYPQEKEGGCNWWKRELLGIEASGEECGVETGKKTYQGFRQVLQKAFFPPVCSFNI